jgi:hypothetical protein
MDKNYGSLSRLFRTKTFKKVGMKDIVFTDMLGVSDKYQPIPASKMLPEWYRQMNSYVTKEKVPNLERSDATNSTIKKCIPVFDALTLGYYILSPADVFVSQRDGVPYYEWANHDLITFHPKHQAPTYPNSSSLPNYPKWVNPWSIKTPKGYSCLFTTPKHRENIFTIFDGVVDCDTYTGAVNFPFVLNDITFEGLIPAGTPIAQVIPFKRDSFKLKIGNEKDKNWTTNIVQSLKSLFFDSYKKQFWHRKEYT